MNCKTLHTKIIFFLEGELPASEMEEIKIHLENCSDCAAFANEMKKTLAVIENEKMPHLNPYFYTRVKAKLENQAENVALARQTPVLVRILQPAVFSLLLLAGIYSGIKIGQPAKINSDVPVFSENEVVPYFNEMETEAIENFLME
ncbi:MAG: anti-sigma factor [Draconibacterium sp.]